MAKNRSTRAAMVLLIVPALVVGLPQSARADSVTIASTTINTKAGNPSDVFFDGDTWSLSSCSKSKVARKGYMQVKSGKKWKKLKNVSKSSIRKNLSQCNKTYPYLTEFTFTETTKSKRYYRVFVPGQSGYKTNFSVSKKLASSGGSSGGGEPTKLDGCYFGSKKLAGSVYFTNSQLGSDFSVYVSSSYSGSDLSVYLHPTTTFASIATCGEWHLASSAWQADFVVYETSSALSAEFVINYVSFSWNAGLN